jgi:hypothetical protein
LIAITGLILAAIAAVAAIGALWYSRKSYQLDSKRARPKPNVRVYFNTRGKSLTEPVIFWQQPLNANTSPRDFVIVASNNGAVATSKYRLSLFAPSAIEFATGDSSAAIPGIQLGTDRVTIDGNEYSEAYFNSEVGLQISETPQPVCQGSVVGKCGTVDHIIWRFTSDGYEAEGRIKAQLN